MNFHIGQEVEIIGLARFDDKCNVAIADRGVVVDFNGNSHVKISNPKFKGSAAGQGLFYALKSNVRVVESKPSYKDSGRNKLRLWLRAICKKYDFTLEQLSLNLGFNESYLSNVGSKSRFEKRGDINSEEYRKLVNNFLVDDYKECRHTIAQFIEQIDSLDDDLHDVKFKYDRCIYSLEQANKNTEYWMRKLPKTRFQAFKLFMKMMFGGQP